MNKPVEVSTELHSTVPTLEGKPIARLILAPHSAFREGSLRSAYMVAHMIQKLE